MEIPEMGHVEWEDEPYIFTGKVILKNGEVGWSLHGHFKTKKEVIKALKIRNTSLGKLIYKGEL